jgi:hypothetical protein
MKIKKRSFDEALAEATREMEQKDREAEDVLGPTEIKERPPEDRRKYEDKIRSRRKYGG